MATVLVVGATCPGVSGSFDAVVRLARGRERMTVEAVDPAGNARAAEVEVRCGATGPEAGAVAMVVGGALVVRWVMQGGRERRVGRPVRPTGVSWASAAWRGRCRARPRPRGRTPRPRRG